MRKYMYFALVVLLGSAMLCSSTIAGPSKHSGFSAIQGVNAEALSADEMHAISGQLNAYDIAAALTAEATKLSKYPKLQSDDLKLASYFLTNAVAINAAFQKFGVLTPCQTCK
jgi:hypothetical protein